MVKNFPKTRQLCIRKAGRPIERIVQNYSKPEKKYDAKSDENTENEENKTEKMVGNRKKG